MLFLLSLMEICLLEHRSNNFIIGLTNVSPAATAPTLYNYAICGQYQGAVPAAATVTVDCGCGLDPYRYLIVQFPHADYAHFCELQVFPHSKFRLRSQHNNYLSHNSFK